MCIKDALLATAEVDSYATGNLDSEPTVAHRSWHNVSPSQVEDLARLSMKESPVYVGVDDAEQESTVDGLEQVLTPCVKSSLSVSEHVIRVMKTARCKHS